VTAEEAGLRGPNITGSIRWWPAGKTAADINLDMFMPWGRVRDVNVLGAERTTLYPIVEEAARRFGLQITPDPRPEAVFTIAPIIFPWRGWAFRRFRSIRARICWASRRGPAKKLFDEFEEKHYHQPSDEYHDDWDLRAWSTTRDSPC